MAGSDASEKRFYDMKTFKADNEFFNARDTLESGQIFRYKSINDGFLVLSGDKACRIKDEKDGVYITCEECDEEYFKNYFDLDFSYADVFKKAEESSYDVVKNAAREARGVRILRQNSEEMIFSFIISQNNMIPRIKAIIERTAQALGEKKSFMGEEYFSFPKAEVLAKQSADFYYKSGYGYRADYMPSAAKSVLTDEFNISEQGLTTAELRKRLMKIKGVGPKVADCVALFGYHRADSFPVDTWIEKLYREDFKGTLKDRKKITDFFLNEFGEYSGYIQQYIFYYKRTLENRAEKK